MRYFLTINASRPYVAGGFTFTFEPVQNRGGSWLGVLAVEEDSVASTLAAAGLYGVEEITVERYDTLKKKVARMMPETSASQRQQQAPTRPPNGVGVRLVEQSGRVHGGNPLIPRAAPAVVAAPPVESVSLQSTSAQPPVEALLDSPSIRAAKRVPRRSLAA